LADARKAADSLDQSFTNPPEYDGRKARLWLNCERLAVEFERNTSDPQIDDWVNKGKTWRKLLGVIEKPERKQGNHDDKVRSLVSPTGDGAGYIVCTKSGSWVGQTAGNTKMVLQAAGHAKAEAECIMGAAVDDPWQLVTLPFQPTFPGGRRYNPNAPQLAFTPAERDTPHPHWDTILDHAGQSLTPALKDLPWANAAGIRTGGDYLRTLLACIIRAPFEPTPYLFFHGPENSGKSIVWEAAELLFTRGVVKADRALTNQQDFNGELAGALICVVEEKDISKTPGALNKIKDAVTSPTLSIRKMRTDSYSQPNSTHWFQFSNSDDALPVFPGDTRITSVYVPALAAGAEIPKAILKERLKSEAPAFLRTLADLTLPPLMGRLRLPVVETEEKTEKQMDNAPVALFLKTCCHYDPDSKVAVDTLVETYNKWAIANGNDVIGSRDRSKFSRELRLYSGYKIATGQKVGPKDKRENAYGGVALGV
jgi:hypothetical protein